jgi:hypothetical protein
MLLHTRYARNLCKTGKDTKYGQKKWPHFILEFSKIQLTKTLRYKRLFLIQGTSPPPGLPAPRAPG